MIYLFEFMNTTFPKAGVLLGGIPITVAEILLLLSILICFKDIKKVFLKIRGLLGIYIIFSFIMIITLILNMGNMNFGIAFTVFILIISPLTIAIGYNLEYEKFTKILTIALLITGLYSILQWVIGIEETAIYGLNIAYGDSFLNKPLGWGTNGMEAVKMPSTYQNGNGVALFYVLGIPYVMNWGKIGKKWGKIRLVAIILGTVGLILSGSRSAMIPFLIVIPYLINNYRKKLKKNKQRLFYAILLLIIVLALIYILVYNSEILKQAIDRYIIETLSDSTGNGRTQQIKRVFDTIFGFEILIMIKSIFFGVSWNIDVFCEGVLYVFSHFGIIAFTSFIALLIIPIKYILKTQHKLIAIGLICVSIAFLVDTSFNSPPGLMNYFLIIGSVLNKQNSNKLMEVKGSL